MAQANGSAVAAEVSGIDNPVVALTGGVGEGAVLVMPAMPNRDGEGERQIRSAAPPQAWGCPTIEDKRAAINMLPNADPTTLHSCDACNKDITGLCYMRCVECKACKEQPNEVDLCADCFYSGQEPFNHKKTHSYRVMDKLHKPVYTEDWTAAEELSLANQTRRLGLGAWEDIADSKLFYRNRSASELNTRYLDTYLGVFGSVHPPHHLKQRPDGTVERIPIPLTDPGNCDPSLLGQQVSSREIRSRSIAELGTNPQYRYEPSWQTLAKRQEDAKRASSSTSGGGGGAPPSAAAKAASNGNPSVASHAVTTTNDSVEGGGGAGGGGGGSVSEPSTEGGATDDGVSGDNSAEQQREQQAASKVEKNRKKKRSKVEKVNKNKEEERAIREWVEKLPGADLSVYHPLRGDFDHEHDDAAEELLANMEFRPTDHASEKQLKLDVIAVYNHRLDEREKRKRFVIDHNLLDVKRQIGGKKRLKEERELVARLRPFARFHTAKEHDELIDNLLLAKKMRARIEQLQIYRENGITTLAEGVEFDLAKKREQEELATRKHRESASYLYDGHTSSSKGNNRERNSRYHNRHKDGGMQDGAGEDGQGGNLMDLTGAPGVEFLSPAERLLCSQLHLLPGYYLVIKERMIQECARAGFLKRKNVSSLAVMDPARLNKMYDFFTTCGWVSEHEQQQDFQYPSGSSSSA